MDYVYDRKRFDDALYNVFSKYAKSVSIDFSNNKEWISVSELENAGFLPKEFSDQQKSESTRIFNDCAQGKQSFEEFVKYMEFSCKGIKTKNFDSFTKILSEEVLGKAGEFEGDPSFEDICSFFEDGSISPYKSLLGKINKQAKLAGKGKLDEKEIINPTAFLRLVSSACNVNNAFQKTEAGDRLFQKQQANGVFNFSDVRESYIDENVAVNLTNKGYTEEDFVKIDNDIYKCAEKHGMELGRHKKGNRPSLRERFTTYVSKKDFKDNFIPSNAVAYDELTKVFVSDLLAPYALKEISSNLHESIEEDAPIFSQDSALDVELSGQTKNNIAKAREYGEIIADAAYSFSKIDGILVDDIGLAKAISDEFASRGGYVMDKVEGLSTLAEVAMSDEIIKKFPYSEKITLAYSPNTDKDMMLMQVYERDFNSPESERRYVGSGFVKNNGILIPVDNLPVSRKQNVVHGDKVQYELNIKDDLEKLKEDWEKKFKISFEQVEEKDIYFGKNALAIDFVDRAAAEYIKENTPKSENPNEANQSFENQGLIDGKLDSSDQQLNKSVIPVKQERYLSKKVYGCGDAMSMQQAYAILAGVLVQTLGQFKAENVSKNPSKNPIVDSFARQVRRNRTQLLLPKIEKTEVVEEKSIADGKPTDEKTTEEEKVVDEQKTEGGKSIEPAIKDSSKKEDSSKKIDKKLEVGPKPDNVLGKNQVKKDQEIAKIVNGAAKNAAEKTESSKFKIVADTTGNGGLVSQEIKESKIEEPKYRMVLDLEKGLLVPQEIKENEKKETIIDVADEKTTEDVVKDITAKTAEEIEKIAENGENKSTSTSTETPSKTKAESKEQQIVGENATAEDKKNAETKTPVPTGKPNAEGKGNTGSRRKSGEAKNPDKKGKDKPGTTSNADEKKNASRKKNANKNGENPINGISLSSDNVKEIVKLLSGSNENLVSGDEKVLVIKIFLQNKEAREEEQQRNQRKKTVRKDKKEDSKKLNNAEKSDVKELEVDAEAVQIPEVVNEVPEVSEEQVKEALEQRENPVGTPEYTNRIASCDYSQGEDATAEGKKNAETATQTSTGNPNATETEKTGECRNANKKEKDKSDTTSNAKGNGKSEEAENTDKKGENKTPTSTGNLNKTKVGNEEKKQDEAQSEGRRGSRNKSKEIKKRLEEAGEERIKKQLDAIKRQSSKKKQEVDEDETVVVEKPTYVGSVNIKDKDGNDRWYRLDDKNIPNEVEVDVDVSDDDEEASTDETSSNNDEGLSQGK